MAYTKRVDRQDGFQDVVDETIEALSAEGFGVLTDVDSRIERVLWQLET